MGSAPLQVKMFGTFTLENNIKKVSEEDNRAKKLWLLLAYMIYRRNKAPTIQEYIDLLWGDEERSSNPQNALKTMFHRVRSTLSVLSPEGAPQLILRQGSTYVWNPEIPLKLDTDEFERLCKKGAGAADEDQRLEIYLNALDLYQGDFLSRLGSHLWVIPIAAHYHQTYVQLVTDTLPMLERRGRFREMTELCRSALIHEPYSEELYCCLMKALIQMGNQRDVVTVYDDMSKLFMNNFGILPSEETRTIYREALKSVNDHVISADALMDQLRETAGPGGALVCDYDIFRSIYHSLARSVSRSGDAVHLALVNIQARKRGDVLSRRSLDRVVENLEQFLRVSLRRGDIVSRYSLSQFIIMLPQANFENSQMVCDRILRAFCRQYPHSPATLSFSVHPLEPN